MLLSPSCHHVVLLRRCLPGPKCWIQTASRHATVVASTTSSAPKLSISPLEITKLPTLRFPGRILVITNSDEEKRAEDLLAGHALLGFDSEARPSSALAPKNRSSVIQIASESVACIWRVGLGGKNSLPPLLRRLIEDSSVTKVSQGAIHEVNSLREEWGVSPQAFVDLHQIALHLRTTPRSLQGLAALFLQQRLCKAQRLSDWEQSPLTQAQIEYAAADAWTSRQVLVEMRRAFLCERLDCERLLGASAAARGPGDSPFGSRLSAATALGIGEKPPVAVAAMPSSSSGEHSSSATNPSGMGNPRRSPEQSAATPPPVAQAHQELAGLCIAKGYLLKFDGFESLPTGFRCVFRVEHRRGGRPAWESFRSKRVHASIRSAQDDAASEALDFLRKLDSEAAE